MLESILLYIDQDYRCPGCDHRYPHHQLHHDHIVPKQLGGISARRNIQLLCGDCNARKGWRTMAEFHELARPWTLIPHVDPWAAGDCIRFLIHYIEQLRLDKRARALARGAASPDTGADTDAGIMLLHWLDAHHAGLG